MQAEELSRWMHMVSIVESVPEDRAGSVLNEWLNIAYQRETCFIPLAGLVLRAPPPRFATLDDGDAASLGIGMSTEEIVRYVD